MEAKDPKTVALTLLVIVTQASAFTGYASSARRYNHCSSVLPSTRVGRGVVQISADGLKEHVCFVTYDVTMVASFRIIASMPKARCAPHVYADYATTCNSKAAPRLTQWFGLTLLAKLIS